MEVKAIKFYHSKLVEGCMEVEFAINGIEGQALMAFDDINICWVAYGNCVEHWLDSDVLRKIEDLDDCDEIIGEIEACASLLLENSDV
jgi:hypothetical protein